jgi:hypothetical protein
MLADQYAATSLYGLAAKYYGMLLLATTDPNEKEQLTAKLLDVDLRSGQIESAKQLLANVLLSSDIPGDTAAAKVLNNYFSQNQDVQMAKQMFLSFTSINIAPNNSRPQWSGQLGNWQKLLEAASAAVAESNTPADHNSKTAK